MRSTWSTVVRRVAELLGRRRAANDEGEEETESGFTLIELMVVLLIMGILMAIAIPTFLGVTNGANDRSTQSNLTNAMTSAKAIYAQNGTYPTSTTMATLMSKAEPELKFVTTASTGQNTLSVYVPTATATPTASGTKLYMAAWMTKTTVCWVARDVEKATTTTTTGTTPVTTSNSGVEYGYLHTAATLTGQATCTGANAATATFSRKWPISPAGH